MRLRVKLHNELMKKLAHSMPRSLRLCMDSKGQLIKY
jgi:hypothetical protein